MFEKTKNGSRSTRRNILLFLGFGLAAAIGGMTGFLFKPSETIYSERMIYAPPQSAYFGDETVFVSLDSNQPTLTYYAYSGIVTMLIKGEGQVSGTQYNDAFYTFLDANSIPYETPIMQFDFTLELDGESAYNVLQLNPNTLPYSPTHTYLIRYDAGPEAHAIALRTADRGVSDNSGQLQVTIFGDVSWLQTVTSFVPAPTPAPLIATEGGEVLAVPFANASPIYTQGLYTGMVKLIIKGTGQAGGRDYSDAFYLYERGDHSPYVPPVLGEFAMEVDGGKIHEVLDYAPPYNGDHLYIVSYDVGPEPRRIGFRNTDLTTGDNTGTYYIEVVAGGG